MEKMNKDELRTALIEEKLPLNTHFGSPSFKRGWGGIICMCEQVIPIDSQNCLFPAI